MMRPRAMLVLVAGAAMMAAMGVGCSDADVERRARDAAEKLKQSIPDVHAVALAQNVSPETVTMAQTALTELKEYMGEINGELDRVTINAIQEVQRQNGITDDGILNKETLDVLRKVKIREAG